MKKVVFDTSLAVKWFFPESGRDKALDLKNQHLAGKIKLYTRDLFLYEIVSSFKNCVREKIEEEDWLLAVKALQALRLEIIPLNYEDLDDLFVFSRKLGISVYDCSYVLLAKRLEAPLYTADKKLYLKVKSFVASFLV